MANDSVQNLKSKIQNPKLSEELANWLEFYRELGIEEFYRRAPGSAAPLPATRVGTPVGAHGDAIPQPQAAGKPALEETRPVVSAAPPAPPLRAGVSQTAVGAPSIRPPAPSLSLFEAPASRVSGPETLDQIRADLGDCQRCKLAGGRNTIVFGEGNPHAELVFVGEGPGADEDEQGLPFVGRAGQLLNRMIQMIGMKRQEVYICNVVKCRPPGNRTPEKDEIETCSPFLFRQLESIKPRLICCLGAPAVKTVLGIKEGITRIHGQFYDFAASKALATVHPAYVLRNPREEKILREDFEKIREFLKGK
ncbi:MAG TPA: uracil-DNA glycosylase [Terriglobia bacterium]|nr:uracil-DNA glycosylase [Terriglobia bacterium]